MDWEYVAKMLIVTHEMQFARAVADRIILLDKGKIRDDTTPEEFFDHPKTDLARRFLQSFEYSRTTKEKDRGLSDRPRTPSAEYS